jgi:hypothetical protein
LLAGLVDIGEQRLAEAALVVGDEVGGGPRMCGGRAVVALEPDDLGAGEILVEAQDVVDLGAAPAIDRLVVVADAAEVLASAGPGPEPQPQILRDVGVLVLVDQDVFEALGGSSASTSGCSRNSGSECSSRSPKSQAFSVFSRSW